MRLFTPRSCPRLLLLLAGLAGLSCSDEFATDPTRVPTVTTVAAWRDTMASKDVDTVEIQVTLAGGRPVAGVETRWAVSDTSIVQLVPILDTVVAAGDSTVVEFRAVRRALRRGHVTLTVLVDRPGVVSDTLTADLTVMERWIDVTAGEEHLCAISADSLAYCWGNPLYLGRGTTALNSYVPAQVRDASGAGLKLQLIRAAQISTCGIRVSGSLTCWGYNNGVFGAGAPTGQHFVAVDAASGGLYYGLAMGTSHSCVMNQAYIIDFQAPVIRAVTCAGYNGFGQLGCGTYNACPTAVDVDFNDYSYGVLQPTAIVAGYAHTCALGAGGGAVCWGDNQWQQGSDCPVTLPCFALGQPVDRSANPVRFASLSAGQDATCGVALDGKAYCWGYGPGGVLGAPPDTLCDGQVDCLAGPTHVGGNLRFTQVEVGQTVCGVTVGGDGYCWGLNFFGELGNGTTVSSNAPVLVSGGHKFSRIAVSRPVGFSVGMQRYNCGIRSPDGALLCWGRLPDRTESSVPLRVPEPLD